MQDRRRGVVQRKEGACSSVASPCGVPASANGDRARTERRRPRLLLPHVRLTYIIGCLIICAEINQWVSVLAGSSLATRSVYPSHPALQFFSKSIELAESAQQFAWELVKVSNL